METDFVKVILTLLAALDLACIIAVIFFERKNPASTIAWVLLLISLPFVGFLAYLMLGSGFHLSKKKRFALKAAYDDLYDNFFSKHINFTDASLKTDCDIQCRRMVKYLRSEGEAPLTHSNKADIFTDGASMFGRMKEDMRKARDHIHVLFYIFKDDELGRDILDILEKKAAAGVEVRLVYDSIGSMLASSRKFERLEKAGGKIAVFSPFFSKSLSSQLRLNYRNHRKITVIDGYVGYVGGMNVGIEYLGLKKKLSPWRDTHMRLTGGSVWALQERFFMDWCFASDFELNTIQVGRYFPKPREKGDLDIQIVSSGPDTSRSTIKSGMLEMIYSAMDHVYIQTPYFTPDESFLESLGIAARSGVDVRIMIPGIGDHVFVQWATLSFAKLALESGARVFAYNGFLHAKMVVADSRVATVGSTNICTRSFMLNFEVNAFVYNRDFALRCEDIFLRDQNSCDELSLDWFAGKNPVMRSFYSVSRLLAPLI